MNSFFRRFQYALSGLIHLLKNDRNYKMHVAFFVVACGLGFWLDITSTEWLVILLCSAMVFGLEAMNSSIETLSDHVHPERHEQIRIVKDVAAGAVLIAAIFALVCGLIIFAPKLLLRLGWC